MRASAHRSAVAGLLFGAALVCASGHGAERSSPLPPGFLEYLGTLVDQEGEWVDALEMNDGALPEGEAQVVDDKQSGVLASPAPVSSEHGNASPTEDALLREEASFQEGAPFQKDEAEEER